MSDKGRGHRISPVNGKSKLAYNYSPCPKIDPDYLGIPLPPNGRTLIIFIPRNTKRKSIRPLNP